MRVAFGFAGRAGTGMTVTELERLARVLKPLQTPRMPLDERPDSRSPPCDRQLASHAAASMPSPSKGVRSRGHDFLKRFGPLEIDDELELWRAPLDSNL